MTTDSPSDTDDQQATGANRRWLPVVIALAVVAVIVVVVLLVAGGDDDDGDGGDDATDEPAGPVSLPEDAEPVVDEEGQELLDLLESGRDLTNHATYTATGDPAQVGEVTIQVWRRDGLVRTDTRQVTDAGTVETAGFLLEDNSIIACNRANEGEWTCAQQEEGSEDSADSFFGTYAQQLQGQDVTVADEEIDGRAARCFSVTGEDGEVSFCITPEGLPVRLRGQGSELLLTALSDDVPDDVFTPPAEPLSAEG